MTTERDARALLDAAFDRAIDDAATSGDSALLDALIEVGPAMAPAVEPPRPQLRARLLAAAMGNGHLAKFVDRVAAFFDVTLDKASALLDGLDATDGWEAGPMPVISLIHFSGGARVAGADVGFVRIMAGVPWPLHRHMEEERMLLLRGSIVDDRGVAWGPGEELIMGPGTEHSFQIGTDEDLVFALYLRGGVEMPPGTPLMT